MCMRLHLTQNGRWMFHEGSDTDPNANEFWTVQVDIIYNCDFLKKIGTLAALNHVCAGLCPISVAVYWLISYSDLVNNLLSRNDTTTTSNTGVMQKEAPATIPRYTLAKCQRPLMSVRFQSIPVFDKNRSYMDGFPKKQNHRQGPEIQMRFW